MKKKLLNSSRIIGFLMLLAAFFALPCFAYAADPAPQAAESAPGTPAAEAGMSLAAGTSAAPGTLQETPGTYAASSSSPLTMGITFGIENFAKPTGILPVTVSLENDMDSDFSGNVILSCGDREKFVYSYDCLIPARKSTEETYYLPLPRNADSFMLTVTDSYSGNAVLENIIPLAIERNTAQLFIGLLCDAPNGLSYFDDKSVDYGLIHTKAFDFDSSGFPEDEAELNLLDVIVVSGFKISKLGEAKTRALMNWVKAGGTLIFGTGKRADDTLGRFAPELLDEMYGEPEELAVELYQAAELESPDDAVCEVPCVDIRLHGGSILSQSSGNTVLSSVGKEKGTIIVAAYDFTDLDEFARSHYGFVDAFLCRILGASGLAELISGERAAERAKYTATEALINKGDVDRFPPVSLCVIACVAYILLASAGLYLFLRQFDLSRFYRTGVIALAILFTAIIYTIGGKTRFRDTFYNYANIIEAGEENVTETTFLNLRNPASRPYTVGISGDYSIYPLQDVLSDKESRITVEYGTGGSRITAEGVSAFNPRFYELKKTGENAGGSGFTGEAVLFEDTVSGTIRNQSSCDVENAVLLFYGRMVLLGNMAAGEERSLDGCEVINIPADDSLEACRMISGGDEKKASMIGFYRSFYMQGYTPGARVMAFAGPGNEHDAVITPGLEGSGISLITSAVIMDNEKGKLVYENALVKHPSVISGNYDADTNTMLPGEPAVLEYQLGTGLSIESVSFEMADSSVFPEAFAGRMYLYNFRKGSYDQMESGGIRYDKTALAEYLSPSNTITVRYNYTGKYSGRISLPGIGVTGTPN